MTDQEEQSKNGQRRPSGYLMLLAGDERRTSDAALGIALRGAGHNLRVHIIAFLKGGRERGEVHAVSMLSGVTLSQYGLVGADKTVDEVEGPAIEPDRLDSALSEAASHVDRRVTNILILDGLLTLIAEGVVPEEKVLEFLQRGAPWLDVVITGRTATDTLKQLADSVTFMDTIKSTDGETKQLRRGIHY